MKVREVKCAFCLEVSRFWLPVSAELLLELIFAWTRLPLALKPYG